ncbi:unnamed protein product [Parnassius apollo]|uniref:(apollo) hypothetical protein n=1 Tax=Parnassius apollo TaxID=110799 RepID=A0A8S3W521_PARAO|nr:unnamed protein product [Parnassius apollo]
MDEEVEVKAPVTRLRRRMSVEQFDDGKSSPAPSTPTKKRGGRRLAKSELDLIDENVENNLKNSTRKSVVKDIVDTVEDKPVTPSRRSTRIKSNTSIVSDTVQNIDSPRAKRAARRMSQVGSDNEMPLTPVRQTRRTRKDSTSNVEKQVEATSAIVKNTTPIPEIIVEEPDNVNKTSNNEFKNLDNEDKKQSPVRKSPRLLSKKSRSSNSSVPDDENSSSVEGNKSDTHNTSRHNNCKTEKPIVSLTENTDNTIDSKADIKISDKHRLSLSSTNLIKDLDTNPKKIFSHINKSLSEAQKLNKVQCKRHRTKSWTAITTVSVPNEGFYSDSENVKKKHKNSISDVIKNNILKGSGDNSKLNESNIDELNSSENYVKSSKSKKKKESDTFLKQTPNKFNSNEEANNLTSNHNVENVGQITNLFQKDPSSNIRTLIVMEDSDSNSIQINIQENNEDQCVPVVVDQLENRNDTKTDYILSKSFQNKKEDFKDANDVVTNDTCEPMDVDVTLPDILQNKKSEMESKLVLNSSIDSNSNNTRRKSSDLSTSQNQEKSDSENKSTCIFSQLKDISSTDNNTSKSPQISNNKRLSKLSNILDNTQEDTKVNKNLSLNYLTSTPLQQKTGTSDQGNNKSKHIFDSNISKEKVKITTKKDVSGHPATEDSISEKESTSSENNLIDNEAEEASNDYESGDSQDDEERQYQIDNEILEKGETLTSEDELTNDSDYEKDSFIVSSDEEDNELLSGSGDDLSMSDKELKMTTKSKKKYNKRKLKEQKQASREMFEARHKLSLSSSSKSSKLKKNILRQRLESSQSEDDIVGSKKNKRNRLNSTANDHAIKFDTDNSITQKKKKKRGLSESLCNETLLVEKEITVCEETINNVTDPLGTQIKSEPNTPAKESNNSVGFINTDIIKGTPCEKSTSDLLKLKDPLEDSDDSSSNLSSAEENIAQNYDKMLNELKIKSGNQSLNMDEKYTIKSNPKIPIVENLNLTQSKKSKNKSSQSGDTLNTNRQSTSKMVNVKSTDELCPKAKPSDKLKQKSLENDCSPIKQNNIIVEKSKLGNVSLNSDKKTKTACKQSIMDQLNITQIKKKLISSDRKKNMSDRSKAIENSDSDDSSDSIDLKLLFSEDSTNSGDLNKESRRKSGESLEDFIPLKKSQAKTDIRAREDTDSKATMNNKLFLDENVLKTKKPKALPENEEGCSNEKGEETPFFVDTFGTHTNSDSSANEDNEAKIKMHNTSHANNASSTEDSEDDDAPLEMSCIKEKSTIKEDNLSKREEVNNFDESGNAAKKSKANTSESKIKKVKKMSPSHNLSQHEKTIDKSLTKTPETVGKKKKMSGSFNVSNLESIFSLVQENSSSNDESINKTLSSEIKKIKKLSDSNVSDCEEVSALVVTNTKKIINKSVTKTPKSEKKKKSRLSESLNKFDENFSEANNTKEDLFGKDQIDTKSGKVKSKNDPSDACSKKRKRKSSVNPTLEVSLEDKSFDDNSKITNKSVLSQNKKRKISQNSEDSNEHSQDIEKTNISEMAQNTSITIKKEAKQDVDGSNVNDILDSSKILNEPGRSNKSKKKIRNSKTENQLKDSGTEQRVNTESCKQNIPHRGQSKNQDVSESVNPKLKINRNKKRKHRDDDDDANKALKVLKENSLDQIHIPRLPHSLLNLLEDKPNKEILTAKKHKPISTTEFVVEETMKRKNKPSNYLEESVYINDYDSPEAKQQRAILKKPKVLPFIPTASTSNSGFTTNFKVNIVSQEIKFVAQSNNVTSFKNDYLYSQKIKRLGTYDLYKRNRNIKISKF